MTEQKRIDRGMYWDRALSVVSGCTPTSDGCLNCWSAAEASMRARQTNPKIHARYAGLTTDGRFNGTVRCNANVLDLPLRTRKPTTWAIWTDCFHPDVPDGFIAAVLAAAMASDRHRFLICTKRPARMANLLTSPEFHEALANHYANRVDPDCRRGDLDFEQVMEACGIGEPLTPNLWLGTTCEDQAAADERIPHLMRVPARVRFLSCEPLLGPVDLPHTIQGVVHQVIIGCESGHGRRTCEVAWVRSLVKQCRTLGIAVFVKQLPASRGVIKSLSQFPDDLQIREFPQ